ncbi:hypothetical protein Avbf_04803, partial [Armadillidium vulgare]
EAPPTPVPSSNVGREAGGAPLPALWVVIVVLVATALLALNVSAIVCIIRRRRRKRGAGGVKKFMSPPKGIMQKEPSIPLAGVSSHPSFGDSHKKKEDVLLNQILGDRGHIPQLVIIVVAIAGTTIVIINIALVICLVNNLDLVVVLIFDKVDNVDFVVVLIFDKVNNLDLDVVLIFDKVDNVDFVVVLIFDKEVTWRVAKARTNTMYAPSSYNDTVVGETLSSISEKSRESTHKMTLLENI